MIPLSESTQLQVFKEINEAIKEGGKAIQIVDDQDTIKANSTQRKNAQNDLMWAWSTQKSIKQGSSMQYVHGEDKYRLLLPLYKSWGGASLRRAEYIQEILDHVPTYEHKIFVSYDMIRTRNLSIKRMAEYLTRVKEDSDRNGIFLESNSDLEFKNLMVYADQSV